MQSAFDTVVDLFLRGLTLLMAVFATIDGALRELLARAGVPPDIQTWILIAAALVLFVIGFKVLGGFLRVLLILFLALLVVQLLGPLGSGRPRRADLPAAALATG